MVGSLARSLSGVVLVAMAVIVCSAAPGWCAGPDWVFLDENQDSRFYYDQSGPKAQEGIVKVRTRVVYSDEGKAEAIKILGDAKKYQGLFESRYAHEVDCKEERGRLLEASHLDENGQVLKRSDLSGVTKWEDLPGDDRMALVLDKTCAHPPVTK